jgi:hypothetical protein
MKRFILAIALTALMCVPVLAGNIPTNGAASPEQPPTAQSATTMSTALAKVVLTIFTLIGQ